MGSRAFFFYKTIRSYFLSYKDFDKYLSEYFSASPQLLKTAERAQRYTDIDDTSAIDTAHLSE